MDEVQKKVLELAERWVAAQEKQAEALASLRVVGEFIMKKIEEEDGPA